MSAQGEVSQSEEGEIAERALVGRNLLALDPPVGFSKHSGQRSCGGNQGQRGFPNLRDTKYFHGNHR